MHTFTPCGSNVDQVLIHHNGDYSGDVIVRTEKGEVTLPAWVLIEFVAEYVRGRKISAVEDMSVDQLLGVEESP